MSTSLADDPCVEADDVAAFLGGRMDAAAAAAFETHVARCADCRELLSALARSESLIAIAPTLGSPERGEDEDEELARGALVGRYVVQGRLGAGGMGVVYAAHDPELDRRVALKLLRGDAFTASLQEPLRERLRQEAQAMARLAHPNVVTVFDVGSFGGRIFIAMEMVDGVTLAAWLASRPRRWQEVVAIFVQAGHGLAAAHAAGLVHRDFKPENVLIGSDGRVRVSDFGLARAVAAPGEEGSGTVALRAGQRHTQTGSLVGTPFYMAPEQYLGDAVDHRTDQFSFCVAVSAALTGQHPFEGMCVEGKLRPPPRPDPVPGWLRRVLERGLAVAPGARYPSMDALLAALGRNPTRRLLVGASVTAAVLLVALGGALAYRSTAAPATALLCKGAERHWAGVWDAARATQIEQAFLATGKPYAAASFARVKSSLDAYARDWSKMHTEACEATRVRGDQPEALLQKRMVCLDARLRDARALLGRFAAADARLVKKAPDALGMLGDLGACADVQALASQVPLPTSAAARARVDEVRGQLAEVKATRTAVGGGKGVEQGREVARAAQATEYRPLEAEALFELGLIEAEGADFKASSETLEKAVWAAEAGRADELAARGWIRLMVLKSYVAGPEAALELRPRVTAALERMGGNEIVEGIYHVIVAQMLLGIDKIADAHAEADQGLALLEKHYGKDDQHVADATDALGAIAQAEGREAEGLAYLERSLAIRRKAYGEDHPEVARAMGRVGEALTEVGRLPDAIAMFDQTLALLGRTVDANHPDMASTYYAYGLALERAEKPQPAADMLKRAVEVGEIAFGKDHPMVGLFLDAYGRVLGELGKYQDALPVLTRALAIAEAASGPEHHSVADALRDLAESERHLHRLDDARAHDARAKAISDKLSQ